MRNYVMLGIPGAGKGTQATRLSRDLGIPHISTGDIFREAARSGSELGRQASQIMSEGKLVPDDIVIGIVRERLSQPDTEKGYILDGFPRTINQAREFSRVQELDAVIYVALPSEEAVNRLKGRRSCSSCGSQFNVYLDSLEDETCPKCGGRLIQRDDDREETVKVRISTYTGQTEPLINYYSEKSLLREVDGSQSIDEVYTDIRRSLDI